MPVGPKIAEGTKLPGERGVIGKNMVFRLFETDDPRSMLAGTSSWTDIGEITVHPVMDTDEIMSLFRKMKK